MEVSIPTGLGGVKTSVILQITNMIQFVQIFNLNFFYFDGFLKLERGKYPSHFPIIFLQHNNEIGCIYDRIKWEQKIGNFPQCNDHSAA